jgi:hypothetical protein
LIDAYLAGLAGCELLEESVFKLMGSHLTIKMMDELCSVLDETKRILQYTRATISTREPRFRRLWLRNRDREDGRGEVPLLELRFAGSREHTNHGIDAE